MRAVYVHPNEQKPGIAPAVAEVCALLQERGVRVLLSSAYFDPALENIQYLPAAEAIPQYDAAACTAGGGFQGTDFRD